MIVSHAIKKRPHVSAELGQLVRDFHLLTTRGDEDGIEGTLARDILLGYRRGERVSTKLSYAAVIFELSLGSRRKQLPPIHDGTRATMLREGNAYYLIASGPINLLESMIDESDVPSRRTYRFPY